MSAVGVILSVLCIVGGVAAVLFMIAGAVDNEAAPVFIGLGLAALSVLHGFAGSGLGGWNG